MKKFVILVLCAVAVFVLSSQTSEPMDYCASSVTKQKAKRALEPYKYDGSKTTRITFGFVAQRKEVEVPLYFGEKYRFVFNREGAPEKVDIDVYNKSNDSKGRELLWTSRDFPPSQDQFVFEPSRARKMYVDYSIAQTSDSLKKGCVIFLLGYQIK